MSGNKKKFLRQSNISEKPKSFLENYKLSNPQSSDSDVSGLFSKDYFKLQP